MVDITQVLSKKTSFWDNITQFNVKALMQDITSYTYNINWVEVATFFGIGLVSGIFFKRYFASFVIILFFGCAVAGLLDYTGIAPINWVHAQNLLGVVPSHATLNSFIVSAVEWAKLHTAIVGYFCFGFVIGFKIS